MKFLIIDNNLNSIKIEVPEYDKDRRPFTMPKIMSKLAKEMVKRGTLLIFTKAIIVEI